MAVSALWIVIVLLSGLLIWQEIGRERESKELAETKKLLEDSRETAAAMARKLDIEAGRSQRRRGDSPYSDQDSVEIWRAIEALREAADAEISVRKRTSDPNSFHPEERLSVCADFTGSMAREYGSENILDSLEEAAEDFQDWYEEDGDEP